MINNKRGGIKINILMQPLLSVSKLTKQTISFHSYIQTYNCKY